MWTIWSLTTVPSVAQEFYKDRLILDRDPQIATANDGDIAYGAYGPDRSLLQICFIHYKEPLLVNIKREVIVGTSFHGTVHLMLKADEARKFIAAIQKYREWRQRIIREGLTVGEKEIVQLYDESHQKSFRLIFTRYENDYAIFIPELFEKYDKEKRWLPDFAYMRDIYMRGAPGYLREVDIVNFEKMLVHYDSQEAKITAKMQISKANAEKMKRDTDSLK